MTYPKTFHGEIPFPTVVTTCQLLKKIEKLKLLFIGNFDFTKNEANEFKTEFGINNFSWHRLI